MALTHGSATRDAIATAVSVKADAGSGAAKLKIRQGSTVLAVITMADPCFGAVASGVITFAGLPKSDASADASGTADNFLLTDSDDNTVLAGSVTAGGGGGDVTMDTTTVTITQPVTCISGSYTAPV